MGSRVTRRPPISSGVPMLELRLESLLWRKRSSEIETAELFGIVVVSDGAGRPCAWWSGRCVRARFGETFGARVPAFGGKMLEVCEQVVANVAQLVLLKRSELIEQVPTDAFDV
jgi:hypothetical protein